MTAAALPLPWSGDARAAGRGPAAPAAPAPASGLPIPFLTGGAVAAAKHVLRELQKRGLLPGLDFGLSTWMNAICIPIPTWQRSGSVGVSR